MREKGYNYRGLFIHHASTFAAPSVLVPQRTSALYVTNICRKLLYKEKMYLSGVFLSLVKTECFVITGR